MIKSRIYIGFKTEDNESKQYIKIQHAMIKKEANANLLRTRWDFTNNSKKSADIGKAFFTHDSHGGSRIMQRFH